MDDFDQFPLTSRSPEGNADSRGSASELARRCERRKKVFIRIAKAGRIDMGTRVPVPGSKRDSSEFYGVVAIPGKKQSRLRNGSLQRSGASTASIATVYMVGGSSDLPIVARSLRERYGKQMRRSPYPHAATAIGSAIAADAAAGYQISERFTRHFGVWREVDGGKSVVLDAIFPKGTCWPENGGESCTAAQLPPEQQPRHFRFVEFAVI